VCRAERRWQDERALPPHSNTTLNGKWWMRRSLSHPPNAGDYSSPAPSDGSSAASIFESRFMLLA
jgi:hypothetical protein